MINTIVSISLIMVLIWAQWLVNKRQQKRHDEQKEMTAKHIDVTIELSQEINKLQVDTAHFESLKRWMSATIDELQLHGDRVETLQSQILADGEKTNLDAIIDDMQRHGSLTLVNPANQTIERVDGKEELIKSMRQMVEVQGQSGNWDFDDYMCGMFNGMELMLSVAENRNPIYKESQKPQPPIDIMQEYEKMMEERRNENAEN